MKILIRTDSSHDIGSGHLMRCLTLADAFKVAGAAVHFICRDLPGNMGRLVEEKGHALDIISPNNTDRAADAESTRNSAEKEGHFDWLIVDHYALDEIWHKLLRPFTKRIMVIDDLADRRHDCDLLLDQNLYKNFERRYDHLVPDQCRLLLGPEFALLRPEFAQTRRRLRPRDGSINRILISMGGADPNNVTVKALTALTLINRNDIAVDVVAGAANPHIEDIEKRCCPIHRCNLYHPAQNMADLMAEADLCLGAGGSTTWERCCLGLPALFIATSDNEIELARSCSRLDIGKYLGRHNEVSVDAIHRELRDVLKKPDLIQHWSKKAASLVDGLGAKRVYQVIMEYARVEVRL